MTRVRTQRPRASRPARLRTRTGYRRTGRFSSHAVPLATSALLPQLVTLDLGLLDDTAGRVLVRHQHAFAHLDAIVAGRAILGGPLRAQLDATRLRLVFGGQVLQSRAMAESDPFSPGAVTRQLDYCTFCPKMCRHACPVSTASGRETYIPQVKMDRLNQLRLGRSAWNTESTDPLWACTGCRHCTMYCDHGNEPGLVLFSGRAVAVERGTPHPALTNYSERFRAREQRLTAQLATMFGGDLATSGEVGFFPGCDAIDKGAGDIAAALALFERVGLDDVRIVDAPQACAGYPLLAAGHRDLFRWHAGRVAASLRGFRKIAIGCSACLYSLRAQYPAEGVNLRTEIISLAELLAPVAGSLACPVNKRSVYYHDPCYHARYNGVVDQPRRALSQLVEVRELGWSKTDTECCGGGGLLPKTMPLVADQMAKRRLAEVQSTGGGMVVTSCATCTFMLERNAPPSVEVVNLASAMARLSETPFTPPAAPADADEA